MKHGQGYLITGTCALLGTTQVYDARTRIRGSGLEGGGG